MDGSVKENRGRAATAVAEQEPASVLAGRYEVQETLGGGAFGVVHKAWDRLLHRTVAIKVMRLEALVAAGIKRDEVLKRFEREATTAAGLTHPAIVTVYDIGIEAGVPYLAMEYVDSVGLDRTIAREGPLGPDRASLIALEVAEALDYAHGHGVLHRDVKPQNIVVPRSGARPVKLVDFGLAKALDCTDHLTRTGTFLGTPSYASPEQVGGEPMDGRSDVWSIGCVLYEMLTGEKAFSGISITEVVVKIMTVEPPGVRALDPGIPEELARIVGKAMAKDPGSRYASAGQLAADLRRFVRSRAAAGAEASPPVRSAPPLADAVGATVIVPATGGPAPAEPVAGPPGARVRTPPRAAAALALLALVLAGIATAALMLRPRQVAPGNTPAATTAVPTTPSSVVAAAPAAATPAQATPVVSSAPPSRPPAPPRARTLPVRAAVQPTVMPPSAPPEQPDRNAEAGVNALPEKIALDLPAYPRSAPPLRPGQKVSVTVSYVVAVDGSVSDVGIVRSSGVRAVDAAVVAAVGRARYRPGTKDGAPVATRMVHGFSFRGE